MKRLKNEQGFTLLEMLFVLFIVMCLTGIVTRISMKVTEAKEIEHFYTQLQLDIQFIQMSSVEQREHFSIKFSAPTNSYSINKTLYNITVYQRPFPKNVEFLSGPSSFVTIRYKANGNVSQSGTLYFKTPIGDKKVVITLGAGRVRVE
ncbi:competence protein ComG [Lysinibacillus contaminans]|uniref:Competence protein ComG n=1 Tax=Lysinibacillus contaminans TaxID=1293441 RepID=A0ABR5JZM0_9BACI|nr:competence type IV pilus minor pilin ComGD [Lysinibacillus contaminans]KOS68074.1 competence protein ComG [Lysinibacillus contaminans]